MPDGAKASVEEILDLLSVGVLLLDHDGNAYLANRHWSTLTAQVSPAWHGNGWLAILEPARRSATLAELIWALRSDGTYVRQWPLWPPGVPVKRLHVTASPNNDGGRGAGIVLTAFDAARAGALSSADVDPADGRYLNSFRDDLDRAAGLDDVDDLLSVRDGLTDDAWVSAASRWSAAVRDPSGRVERTAVAVPLPAQSEPTTLAMMAQQIRGPLTGLLGAVSVLTQGMDGDAEQRAMVDLIGRQGERLAGILDDLLDRAGTGRLVDRAGAGRP